MITASIHTFDTNISCHAFIHLYIYWQGYWNSYGTDWEGPIPLKDDVEIVHVDQLPSILSEEQKATLQQQIELTGTLTEEWMIKNFAIAKDFVQMLMIEYLEPRLSDTRTMKCLVH